MLPFRDYTLCFTGLQDRKSGLIKILRDMGVKQVEPHLTVDVDVLIADDFGSPKYLVSLGRQTHSDQHDGDVLPF
jgi:hypothetical protein